MALALAIVFFVVGIAGLVTAWAILARRDETWSSSVRMLAAQVAEICYPSPTHGGLRRAMMRLVESTTLGAVSGRGAAVVPSVLPAFQNLTLRAARGAESGPSLVKEFWAALDALRPAGQPYAAESAHELTTASFFVAALSDAMTGRAIREAVSNFAVEFNNSDVSGTVRFDILATELRPTDTSRWAIHGTSESDVKSIIYRLPLLENANAEVKVRAQGWTGPAPVASSSTNWRGRFVIAVEGLRASLPRYVAHLWWIAVGLLTVAMGLAVLSK